MALATLEIENRRRTTHQAGQTSEEGGDQLVHDGKWSGKASIAKLHRLLIDSGGFEVPSPDTLARLVERLHAETGEAEFFRAKRTRRK